MLIHINNITFNTQSFIGQLIMNINTDKEALSEIMCMAPLHVVNSMPPLDQTVSYFTCYIYIFIKTEPLTNTL